jgi:ABC-type Mn2+/Zn2+ transport system ATPase subunit
MELVRTSGRNILLVGPEGAGKSCLVNDFLDKQGAFYGQLLYSRVMKTEKSDFLLVYFVL